MASLLPRNSLHLVGVSDPWLEDCHLSIGAEYTYLSFRCQTCVPPNSTGQYVVLSQDSARPACIGIVRVDMAKRIIKVVGRAAAQFIVGAIVGCAIGRFVPITPPDPYALDWQLRLSIWFGIAFGCLAIALGQMLEQPMWQGILVGLMIGVVLGLLVAKCCAAVISRVSSETPRKRVAHDLFVIRSAVTNKISTYSVPIVAAICSCVGYVVSRKLRSQGRATRDPGSVAPKE